MKHFLVILSLVSPFLLFGQNLNLELPTTDFQEIVKNKYAFEVKDDVIKITANFYDNESKDRRREIYTAPLNVIDTILLAIDNKESVCEIRVYAADNVKAIQQKTYKLYPFFNGERKRKTLYIGLWKIENKDLLMDVVEKLNAILPKKSIQYNTKINSRLSPMISSGGHHSDEDMVYYYDAKVMPSYQNSKTLADRDRVVQSYMDGCVEKNNFEKSGIATVDMVIMEDGSIGKVFVAYVSDKNEENVMEALIENCLLEMPKWSPGVSFDRPRNVQISTLLKINTDEDAMAFLNKQLDKSEKYVKKKREPKAGDNGQIFIPADALSSADDSNVVHSVVEQNPVYSKGDDAYFNWILLSSEKLKRQFPNDSGLIKVRFVVEKNGKVSYPQIVKATSHDAGDAAMELVKTLGDWSPGKTRGKAMRTYRLATFKL